MAILIGLLIILSRIAAGHPGDDNNVEGAPKFRGWDPDDVVARLKRLENNSLALDSKASELEDVKGALKEILSGRNIEELFTYQAEDTTHTHATSRSHRRFDKMIYPETNDETTILDEQELSTITATRSKHMLRTKPETNDKTTALDEQELSTIKATRSKHLLRTKPMEKIEEETLTIEEETLKIEVVPLYRKQEENTRPIRISPLILREQETTTTETLNGTNNNNTTPLPLCYTTTSTTKSTVLTTTTPEPKLDIPALMEIISNFTYVWLSNLTRSVNETLQKKGIPTCAELTTPTPLTTYGENMTGTVMGKCFFCGLDEIGLPRRAYCADAFAGDFLPLMPVEAKARGQISKYRKYCRYKDKHPYYFEKGDTRSVWGAWTGGCAVRWTDLTGIYTQRTCRIRTRPLLGKHYGSKRMAKLELALQNVDNGCIISPAATLLPLSRGISLYARFHACVCTGYWCNRGIASQPWTMYIAIVSACVIAKDFIII